MTDKDEGWFSRQIAFITLVAIYLLKDVLHLLSPFKSLNLFEEVIIEVELLIFKRVRDARAICCFPY